MQCQDRTYTEVLAEFVLSEVLSMKPMRGNRFDLNGWCRLIQMWCACRHQAALARRLAGFFSLGVVPDCLTLFTLPRAIGLSRARNFIYTNGSWGAEEIVENGLALKVVPDDQVEEEGIALAEELAAGPAEVMGLAKQLMLKSFESSLHELMEYEGFGQVLAMSSVEFREGLQALIEKRSPDPKGVAESTPCDDGLPSTAPKKD